MTVKEPFGQRTGAWRWLFFCSVAVGLFAVGCDGDSDSVESVDGTQPFQGVTVRVAVPRELNWAERWKTTLDEWSAQTGAGYEFLEYEPSSLSENGTPPTGDLVLFPISQLAQWRHDEKLAVMPAEMQGQLAINWLDVLPGLRTMLTRDGHDPIAVPLASPVLVCYYRRDLLEQAGLAPPETWDDYEKLVRLRDRWAPGLTVAEPWHPDWRATTFFARAAAAVKHPGYFGIQFDIQSGKPLIAGEGYQTVLKDIVDGLEYRSPEVMQYTPVDCRNAVLNGSAAIGMGLETPGTDLPWPWGVTVSRDAAQPNVRAENIQIGIRRLPGSARVYNAGLGEWETLPENRVHHATVTGFSGIAGGVMQDSEETVQQASWNLLELMTTDSDDMFFVAGERTICRESDTLSVTPWTGDDLTGEEQTEFVQAIRDSLSDQQVFAEIPIIDRTKYREALTDGLTAAFEKQKSPAEALADIAEQWREFVEAAGAASIRDSYRASVGLSKISQ